MAEESAIKITKEPAYAPEEEIIKPKKKAEEEEVAEGEKKITFELKPIEEEKEVTSPTEKKITFELTPIEEEEELVPVISPEYVTPYQQQLFFELEKIPEEEQPTAFLPPPLPTTEIPAPPPYVEPKRPLLIDIETTGPHPWNSRIICIGLVDLSALEPKPEVIVDKDERKMLEAFKRRVEGHGYNLIVGYNVSFDLRFLFAKCMFYRLQITDFFDLDIYDLMKILKQVQDRYVFTMNPPGKLDQWAKFLLGRGKTMSYEEVLDAWEKGEVDKIVEYNKEDLKIETELWQLIRYTKGA